MYVGKLPSPQELAPEQNHTISRLTAGGTRDQIVAIQGVAGSGKTTIALSILRDFAELRAGDLEGLDAVMPVMITYGERLVDACYDTLRKALAEGPASDKLGEHGTLQRGRVNVISYIAFCRHALGKDSHYCLSDRECIEILRPLAGVRGVKLLPEQIFGIIVGFLKGQPAVRGRSADEVASVLREASYGGLRTYRWHISEVRNRVLDDYEDQLQRRGAWDRADLAYNILGELKRSESYYQSILAYTASEVRSATNDPALKRRLDELFVWVTRLAKNLPETLSNELAFQVDVLSQKEWRLSSDDWLCIQNGVRAAVQRYGLPGPAPHLMDIETLRNPVLLIDEVQDLSDIEVEVLARLWFHQGRSERSRLALFGDTNQTMTPTGFTWEHLFQVVEHSANSLGATLSWPHTYKFESAEEMGVSNPFIFLPNNYRSTEDVARFAHNMVSGVVQRQRVAWGEKLCERILANVVDPDRTLPILIQEDVDGSPEHASKPGVIVGDYDWLRTALGRIQPQREDAGSTKRLCIVLGREGIVDIDQVSGRPVSLFPLLGAKGLEFPGVVVAGLPTPGDSREKGMLDSDLVNQWYTALTRARVRLLVYLSPQEAADVSRFGWEFTGSLATRDALDAWLQDVGQVFISGVALEQSGEYYLQQFEGTGREEWLREAIRSFQAADRSDAVRVARETGASYFEDRRQFESALFYFRELDDAPGQVRCLLGVGGDFDIQRALELAQQRYRANRKEDAFVCMSLIWQKTKAVAHGISAVEIGLEAHLFSDAARLAASLEEPTRTTQVLNVARRAESDSPVVAFDCYCQLHDEKSAQYVLAKLSRNDQFDQVEDCITKAQNKLLATNVLRVFAQKLLREAGALDDGDSIGAARFYLSVLADPLGAGMAIEKFVTSQFKTLSRLGVFGADRAIAHWSHDGYFLWLEQTRGFARDEGPFTNLLRRLVSLTPNAKSLTQLSAETAGEVERLTRELLEHSQRVPSLRAESRRWIQATIRAVNLLEPFLQISREDYETVKEAQSALGQHKDDLTLLQKLGSVLVTLAYQLPTSLTGTTASERSGFQPAPPDSAETDLIIAAKVIRTYDRTSWRKPDAATSLVRMLWKRGDWRVALRCAAETGRQQNALDKLVKETPDRWEAAVSILFPEDRGAREKALKRLQSQQTSSGAVVERKPRRHQRKQGASAMPRESESRADPRRLPAKPNLDVDHGGKASVPGLIDELSSCLAKLDLTGEAAAARDLLREELRWIRTKSKEGSPAVATLLQESAPKADRLMGPNALTARLLTLTSRM